MRVLLIAGLHLLGPGHRYPLFRILAKPSLLLSLRPPPQPYLTLLLMATPTFIPSPKSSVPDSSIKKLSASGILTVPSLFASRNPDAEPVVEGDVPIIDFSVLTGGSPEQRSRAVRELGRACEEWGFFMVVNHGVPERLREEMLAAAEGFFDLTEEEKKEYDGKEMLDPIRCGSSFNSTVEEVRYWRDFLKIIVHPEFHSPVKPPCFRDILREYTSNTREMAKELLNGIWESLELDKRSMNNDMDLDSCFQIFIGNLYPPCPQPELTIGLPSHSDHGFLTILFQNGTNGLQVKHNGRWVLVKPLPKSFLVNTGDHMEIVSNGRYKSVLHRAVVNSERTRISVVTALSPSPETMVVPSPHLVTREGNPARYRGMKFIEYYGYQQGNRLKEKTVLDLLRLPTK